MITERLFELRDEEYADFTAKLIPNVPKESILGVRTPALRELAKKVSGTPEAAAFLKELPHRYFEENQLHGFIISFLKDFDDCLKAVDAFLPYVDNWATCDQTSPKVFRKNKDKLIAAVDGWLSSDKTYTVRFGIGVLLEHFLDEDFKSEYAEKVAAVKSEEYYVKMMQAWYFATALAKQYESVLPFIKERLLERWTHNKAIQKAVESRRLTEKQKEYLKTLKVK